MLGRRIEMSINFCLGCGLPLDARLNPKWDKKSKDVCNQKCRDKKERADRPRNKKKYGACGYIYEKGYELKKET